VSGWAASTATAPKAANAAAAAMTMLRFISFSSLSFQRGMERALDGALPSPPR
jgi:hypothetical protein